MYDASKRQEKHDRKEKERRRMRVHVDKDNYEYIPAKKPVDFYDSETPQKVAAYVRVSTDDIRQTTSFELQKSYYEEYVRNHVNWTLVNIYADEGISGTSLKHRDAFNQMIADCKNGKIDLIITKSVSRFARNVMITIGTVRDLGKLNPPVGVFFESESIFSLNEESQMALSFQATMAEEESHTRSRSMEASLRMRLDNGIPLTPKLLGYTHDSDGNLVINEEEAPTVKLAFYMYLFGYSTNQIALVFNALNRRTYLGNVNWTSSSILQILRNERHCGDVLTRKTYTENYRSHRVLKNRGDRPQSRYLNHHEAIISRDDFIAVQHMIDNAKYKNKSFLPELRVMDDGILKGFVTVKPRWAGFKADDYIRASLSVYKEDERDSIGKKKKEIQIEVSAGDLDLRGFEVVRSELLNPYRNPAVTCSERILKFNISCVRQLNSQYAEILINPLTRQIAVRNTQSDNRNYIEISKLKSGTPVPKDIHTTAYGETLFELMGWNTKYKYKVSGSLFKDKDDTVFIFDGDGALAYIKSSNIPSNSMSDDAFISRQALSNKCAAIQAIPQAWADSFGSQFYIHERTFKDLSMQDAGEWKLRITGQLFEAGKKLNVTPFEELKSYIQQELSSIKPEEIING